RSPSADPARAGRRTSPFRSHGGPRRPTVIRLAGEREGSQARGHACGPLGDVASGRADMNKSTKGALAAAAAAVLLMGSAGTLAFWTADETTPGATIDAGHLALVIDGTNTGCGAWSLDSGESVAGTWTDGDPLVPGDV